MQPSLRCLFRRVEPTRHPNIPQAKYKPPTSKAYVASRARDPTFEKLMEQYKWLYKVIPVQDLIVGDPRAASAAAATVPLSFLHRLAQSLHLNRGAKQFLYKFPHIFRIFRNNEVKEAHCRLTDTAVELWNKEQEAIMGTLPMVVDRLVRVLSMSITKTVPLSAVNMVYRELGMPEDYVKSVIGRNRDLFRVEVGEGKRRMLSLVKDVRLVAAVENWRVIQGCEGDGESNVDESESRYWFKHGYPPGMKLSMGFKKKVRAWQRLEYVGPYEETLVKMNVRCTKAGMRKMEKRAVGIVHEFLSVTVEKMVEVEKISQFRKWFGIDMNIRDLFLDHPGIFYLSEKGYRHTVFLREAYERGRLIDWDPVYDVRRKLLDLVLLGRHGRIDMDRRSISGETKELEKVDCVGDESKLEELESDQSDKDESEEVKYVLE